MPPLHQLVDLWPLPAVDAVRWIAGRSARIAPSGTGGYLQLRHNSLDPGQEFVTTQAADWSLVDSYVIAHMIPSASWPDDVQMILHTTASPDGPGVAFSATTSTLTLSARRLDGTVEVIRQLPYDRIAHLRWRFREVDGVVLWDVSTSGEAWTAIGAWFATFPLTALRLTLRNRTVYATEPTGRPLWGPLNVVVPRPPDPVTISSQDGVPYLAVDVQPDNVTGTFLLRDEAVADDGSYIGDGDLLGWSTTTEGSWENVVCDVRSFRIVRGASEVAGPLTVVSAGLCTIELADTERRFDPLGGNVDAVHAGTPFRVRAWGYDLTGRLWDAVLYTGTIDTMPVRYRQEEAPLVTITATDLVSELVEAQGAGFVPAVGAGDTLLGRVQRILGALNMASRLALDVDTTGYAASHPAAGLTQPWTELLAAQDAELGRLWVNAGNQLVVRARRSELSGPVRGTLSDVHGDADAGSVHCCYSDLICAYDTDQVVNRAIASRRVASGAPEGATVVVEDVASVARYRPHVVERSLELQTDLQVQAWADHLVAIAGVPQLSVREVAPRPARHDLDNALDAWPAVCATDLGDRWVVRYHPSMGPFVDRAVGVLGITYEGTPEDWVVRFLTVDAPTPTPGNPSGLFVLDDADVDSGDVLAPNTAQVVQFVEWSA